jgi:hypothetical protein
MFQKQIGCCISPLHLLLYHLGVSSSKRRQGIHTTPRLGPSKSKVPHPSPSCRSDGASPAWRKLRSTLHAERTTHATIPLMLWAGCHIHPPQKELTPRRPNTSTNRANDDQERSLLAHATVCLESAHVPCRAPRRAYTRKKPHIRTPDSHAPVAMKVGSDTICNAPQSPNNLDPLCMLSELHLPPSHLCFRPRFA